MHTLGDADAVAKTKAPAKGATAGELTPQQARFVAEYLVDLNATQAAIRAGYSENTAESQGSRLLSVAKVRAAVDAAMQRRSQRVEVKADDVLRELMRLAFVDLGKAYREDGTLLPIHEIPEDVRRAMAGLEVDEIWEGFGEDRRQVGVTRKVKFIDKARALELLGKNLKLFTDKVEHSGGVSVAVIDPYAKGGGA